MINLTRTLGITAAAALVAITGLTVTAPQASAASCKGTKCNGKNPQTTGCSKDGDTLADATASNGHYFELRYSKKCRAVWLRGDHFADVKLQAGHYDHCGEWRVQKTAKTKLTGYWHIEDTPNWQWTSMISVKGYDYFRIIGDGDSWMWKNKKKSAKQVSLNQIVPDRPAC